jgi:hypothetical protein
MNTGLQDAANLGWKLAAVLRGADTSLLDSYEAERHPVGRQVLVASGTILRLAVLPGPLAAAGRRTLAAALSHVRPARRRAAGVVSAIGVAYGRPRGAHPMVGRRAPDLPLAPGPAGARLAEALRPGRFVLVLPGSSPAPLGVEDGVPFPQPAAGEVDVAERIAVHRSDGDPTGLLVRPDGYVAGAQVTADATADGTATAPHRLRAGAGTRSI